MLEVYHTMKYNELNYVKNYDQIEGDSIFLSMNIVFSSKGNA